jgi:predicted heme/steroid binding protein/uncharacterized membrane protein
MKEFDLKELEGFNGEAGKPVYIAHQGRVIEVTASKMWKGGLHMRRHHAGKDLTTDIQAAPHGLEVLDRYPQVGVLKQDAAVPSRPMPQALASLLERFPLLKRHPHPMTVHFPIAFLIATTVFNLLYLITGYAAFEVTGWHCLGGAVLFTPVAMGTGLFTWWLNYLAKPLRPVSIKIRLTPLVWGLALLAFTWRLAVPDILQAFRPASYIYFLLILSFFPLVTVIGWFGAQMTFPIERE